jgi:hypothetical protein
VGQHNIKAQAWGAIDGFTSPGSPFEPTSFGVINTGRISSNFGFADRSKSTIWANRSLSCCLAAHKMLVSTACVRAPFAVRLPPQFLRIITSIRMTRSATLLVASTRPGQYRKVNK